MPLYSLTAPELVESLTHAKADNLVPKLHQIVKDLDVLGFVLSIEQMALDHVHGCVPLLLLSLQLLLLNYLIHRVRCPRRYLLRGGQVSVCKLHRLQRLSVHQAGVSLA